MEKAEAECEKKKHLLDKCRKNRLERSKLKQVPASMAPVIPMVCREKRHSRRACEDDDRAKFLSLKARFQAITKEEQDRIKAKCEERLRQRRLQQCEEKVCQTTACYKVDRGIDCCDLRNDDKTLEERLCQIETMLAASKNVCASTETECGLAECTSPGCNSVQPLGYDTNCCAQYNDQLQCPTAINQCPPLNQVVMTDLTDPKTAKCKVMMIEQQLSNLGCQMNTSVINKCLYQEQISKLEEEIVNTKRAYFTILMSELNTLQKDLEAQECLQTLSGKKENSDLQKTASKTSLKKKKGKKPGSAKSGKSKKPGSKPGSVGKKKVTLPKK